MDISEFLFANSWFQEKYAGTIEPRRFPTFKAALNLFIAHAGEVIVETGTIRMKDDWGGGYSTYLFGDFCKRYNKRLITIDNSTKNLSVSKEVTAEFNENITYLFGDSIEVLSGCNTKIDLLYLDSLDCNADPEADNSGPQKHQLNELKAAWNNLSPHAVILLDDCIFTNGGKCKMTGEYLLHNGFILILEFYQSLWVR